jgi:hypothetical protein
LGESSSIGLLDVDGLTVVSLLGSNRVVLLVFRQILDLDFAIRFAFSTDNLDRNPII